MGCSRNEESHEQRPTHPFDQTIQLKVLEDGPIADADFQISIRPARINRSTPHWTIEPLQSGEFTVNTSAQELACPQVPAAEEVAVTKDSLTISWIKTYRMRFIDGLLTLNPANSSDSSLSRLWVRDEPPRALDFLSLTAMADVFFPRIFHRLQAPSPAGTVSMTVYYHADSRELKPAGNSLYWPALAPTNCLTSPAAEARGFQEPLQLMG